MQIVTLTTDFGLNDYYVAVLKGSMLQQNPNLHLIDIAHAIKSFDIVQGAFVLKNAWRSFPQGSIHVVSINSYSKGQMVFLAIRHQGHYFVGPDNGIFSLLFDQLPEEIYALALPENSSFPLTEVFANAVKHIAGKKDFKEIGQPVEEILQRITLQPVINPLQIRGAVVHIDAYENVVVNISKELFEQQRNKRKFALFFKRNDPIKNLSTHYHDVAVGEPLCLFNSTHYLEIAINMGKASSMLGLKLGDTIQIDFHV